MTNVRDTSLMAFEELLKRIEPDEQAVYELLDDIGPACDRRILEALNQKESKRLDRFVPVTGLSNVIFRPSRRHWEINQVCGRRNGLVNLGVVRDMGIYTGEWYGKKKRYHFWKVAGDIREPVGWKKYEGKIKKKYSGGGTRNTELRINHEGHEEHEDKSPPMDVHTAGKVMVEWRHKKGHRAAQPTKQLVMF